jgi:hypothetical protein
MSRARRRRTAQEQEPAAPSFSSATWRDGTVVVQIANAGVHAIIAEAERHGLDGVQWTSDMLHPRIAEIIARALRATPEWWVNRTPEKA